MASRKIAELIVRTRTQQAEGGNSDESQQSYPISKRSKRLQERHSTSSPNTNINGVSYNHVKRTKFFKHLGLDDSPQSIEDIRDLEFSDLALIKAQLTKQGREASPLPADIRQSLQRVMDTVAAQLDHNPNLLPEIRGTLINLERNPAYFEGYKTVWLKIRKQEYTPKIRTGFKPSGGQRNRGDSEQSESKMSTFVNYSEEVRKHDYFAVLGIDTSARGRKIVENFSRATMEELRNWLDELEAPEKLSTERIAILTAKGDRVKTTISIDGLPEAVRLELLQLIEHEETRNRIRPTFIPHWETPLQALENKIAQNGEEGIREVRAALNALRALRSRPGKHLERYKGAWLDRTIEPEYLPKTTSVEEIAAAHKRQQLKRKLDRFFAQCRNSAREAFEELKKPPSERTSFLSEAELRQKAHTAPRLIRGNIVDEDPYYLQDTDISRIRMPGNTNFSDMHLEGTWLKLTDAMNVEGAICGLNAVGEKTRLVRGTNLTHVRGWRNNPTFTPEYIDGLEEAKGYSNPLGNQPQGDVIIAAEEKPLPRYPRISRGGKLDREQLKEFLKGKNENNPAILSEYARRYHHGNLKYAVGRNLSKITFPAGTVFDIDMRGVKFRLPFAANVKDAIFGWSEKADRRTELIERSIVDHNLQGWQENKTFHPTNIEGLGTGRFKNLTEPDDEVNAARLRRHAAKQVIKAAGEVRRLSRQAASGTPEEEGATQSEPSPQPGFRGNRPLTASEVIRATSALTLEEAATTRDKVFAELGIDPAPSSFVGQVEQRRQNGAVASSVKKHASGRSGSRGR